MINAMIYSHPIMSAEQLELLCDRQDLALAHLGFGRLMLVQNSNRQQTMLRIALGTRFPLLTGRSISIPSFCGPLAGMGSTLSAASDGTRIRGYG